MAVQLAHSKKQINRAGKLLREVRIALMADATAALDGFDHEDVAEAVALRRSFTMT
jgi:hypothetical protein